LASRPDPIVFLAALPPIQSAISLDGNGGARIKLDVPETEMDAVMRLAGLRGVVFQVTISQLDRLNEGRPR
jgi:hypothetical protein